MKQRTLGEVRRITSSLKDTNQANIKAVNQAKLEKNGFARVVTASAEFNADSTNVGIMQPERAVCTASTEELDPAPSVEPAPAPAPAQPVVEAAAPALDVAQLMNAIATLSTQVQSLQSENAARQQEQEVRLSEVQTKLTAATQEAADARQAATQAELQKSVLIQTFGLDRFQGNSEPVRNGMNGTPAFNRTSVNSDSPKGAVAEFLQERSRAGVVTRSTQRGSNVSVAARGLEIDSWAKKNRSALYADLESWGKANGLFTGGAFAVTNATTTAANIPGGFLETLSSVMRMNNRPGFVFWQFTTRQFDFGARLGSVIDVPRAAFLQAPNTASDRLLSGGGTFYQIDSSRQALNTGISQVILKEWGLGKDSTAPAVGISTFVSAYSMLNLEQILENNLMHDAYAWHDLAIAEQWGRTTRILYNDNDDTVTVNPADLVAGDDGTFTEAFAHSLHGYAHEQQIRPFRTGQYGLWLAPRAATQLKKSLGDDAAPPNSAAIAEISNMLLPQLDADQGQISGYLGAWCGFHCFTSNNYGVQIGKGAQTETIAGGPVTTRNSYVFGEGTVAEGVGMDFEIVQDSTTNFGRLGSYTWLTHRGIDAMDIDPALTPAETVPQELRVLEVRTLDRPI